MEKDITTKDVTIKDMNMLQFTKAGTSDAVVLTSISKHAFDSDIQVGATDKGGPPGYASLAYHTKMARGNHLYKLLYQGLIVGGAILFEEEQRLNVGRIFVNPEYFRKGFGEFMMREIEKTIPNVTELYLDTPIWNVRTNAFYLKQGYVAYKQNQKFVYYKKTVARESINDNTN